MTIGRRNRPKHAVHSPGEKYAGDHTHGRDHAAMLRHRLGSFQRSEPFLDAVREIQSDQSVAEMQSEIGVLIVYRAAEDGLSGAASDSSRDILLPDRRALLVGIKSANHGLLG